MIREQRMRVSVKMFAIARDLAKQSEVELDLSDTATVADLRKALVERVPALAGLQKHLMFAINADYAGDGVTIPPHAEIACIPPVSGG